MKRVKRHKNRVEPKILVKTFGITDYFDKIYKYHEYSGVFFLTGESFSSKYSKIIGSVLMGNGVLLTLITFFASTPYFSTTDKVSRTINILSVIYCLQTWISTIHFISKKEKVRGMITWCKDIELGKISKLLKPKENWFSKYCVNLMKLVKVSFVFILVETIMMTFVFVFGYYYATGIYRLPTVYNLFGYREVDYPVLFWIEFEIGVFGAPFIMWLTLYEYPYFILFALYAKRQLELISTFIKDFGRATDPIVIHRNLIECIEVHTNTISFISEFSGLYKWKLRLNESMIISLVSLSVLAAHQDLTMIHTVVAPVYAILNYFTVAVFIEMILEANSQISNDLYDMEWYNMSTKMQKEILLMQSSMHEITFGSINGQYPLSMERFTKVLKMSYDIGVFIVSIL